MPTGERVVVFDDDHFYLGGALAVHPADPGQLQHRAHRRASRAGAGTVVARTCCNRRRASARVRELSSAFNLAVDPDHPARGEDIVLDIQGPERLRVTADSIAPDPLEGDLPLDPVYLGWTLAACTPLPMGERQELLEATDATERLILVTDLLRHELHAMNVITSLPATEVARTRWSPN